MNKFNYEPHQPLRLEIWIDDTFSITGLIIGEELSKSLQEIQTDGVNWFSSDDDKFTHYPPHRVSKIEVIKRVEEEVDE